MEAMAKSVENFEVPITNANQMDQDEVLDLSLRPKKLSDYVGQEKVKENLNICLEASKRRREPIEHILLYGPPGLGKTTLANIIANEAGVAMRTTSGPAIQRSGDLVSILTNLAENDILFIDEIHRLNRVVEEVLYSAMEDFAVDLIVGKGPLAKSMRLSLPPFTLIGATTKFGALSSPLRDRFGIIHRLEFYNESELSDIVKHSSLLLDIKIKPEGVTEIAGRSRRTPRIANRILKRVRDYAEVRGNGIIDKGTADKAILKLDIDPIGLDRNDREYMLTIIDKFGGGPVGLETIAASLSEDKDTIEDVIEPYLLQLGFIRRTSRGRVATEAAYKHFKISGSLQKKLL